MKTVIWAVRSVVSAWIWLACAWVSATDSGGAVARLQWANVPDTVLTGESFAASLSAFDTNNTPVTPPVRATIRASVFDSNPERSVLQGVLDNYRNNAGRFDIGWSFQAKRTLRITALRAYFGVRIWLKDAAGRTLAEQEVPEGNGTWRELPLREPVALKAGQIYTIQADSGGLDYYAWRQNPDSPVISNDDLAVNYSDNHDLWMVDFKYTPALAADVVSPNVASNFSGGVWTGDLRVNAAGGYVFLEAALDSVIAFSKVFQVLPPNNLRLTQTVAPTIATVGDPIVYTLRAQSSGPDTIPNVVVTNTLPAGVTLLQATTSRGAFTATETNIVFNVGNLEGKAEAVMKIVALVNAPGAFLQEALASADTIDPLPADNKASSRVDVYGVPEIGSNDIYVFSRPQSGLTTNAIFDVTLNAPTSRNVYVDYVTEAGTAVETQDYQPQSGTLLFAPGVVKQRVTLPIADGVAGEVNEKFYLRLSNPVNAALGRERATCQIINPAVKPTVTVADVRVAEGDDEYGVEAVFTFKLSNPMPLPIVLGIQATPGTAHAMTWPAEPGEADYYEVWGGVGFEIGQTETLLGVPINGDTFAEPNETFRMLYWSEGETAITPKSSATATIINDDPTPAVTVGDATVREDSVGQVKLVFPVTLSKPTAKVVRFNYAAVSGTATAAVDFDAVQSAATIDVGGRSTTIVVPVFPDQAKEDSETMKLNLSSPSNCLFMNTSATGTILDAVNKLPKAQFSTPSYGAISPLGQAVTIHVDGTDVDGRVTRMTLAMNGVVQTDVSTNSITLDWMPEHPGTYSLVAQTWDDRGASAVSSEWIVQIESTQQLRIISPNNGAVSAASDPLVVRVDYSGAAALQTLELWSDGALAGTFAPGQLDFAWTNPPEGTRLLSVKGVDVDSNMIQSDPISVTITPARPGNDDFAQAADLVGFAPRATGTTRGATVQANEPIHGNPSARASVWWTWTAPGNGRATLTATNDLGEPLYAVVYLGEIQTTLAAKAQLLGTGSFDVNAGQRYSLALDGVGNYTGPVTLQIALAQVTIANPIVQGSFRAPTNILLSALVNAPAEVIQKVEFFEGATLLGSAALPPYQFSWSAQTNGYHTIRAIATDYLGGSRPSPDVPFVVRPFNDSFQDAIEVSGYAVDIHTSNVGATLELLGRGGPWGRRLGEPTYADNQGGHSIWYRWTVPEDGICTLSGKGHDFYVLLGAYVGNSVSNLAHVASNAGGGWEEPNSFQVTRGTVLNIQVDGMFMEEGAIDWSLRLRPSNDDFARARRVSSPFFETIASLRGASQEPFEAALHPANSISVWWAWQAPATATTTIRVSSDKASTLFKVYTGAPPNLTIVASSGNDWQLSSTQTFNATVGQTYYIAIVAPSGETNDFRLQVGQDLVRLSNPLDGSVAPVNLPVKLAATTPASLGTVTEVQFFVDGILVGAMTNAPYEFQWSGNAPGAHRIMARAVRGNGQFVVSLPITIGLYENNQLPIPTLVVNPRGHESLVENAVGELLVFGPSNPFAAPGGDATLPRLGKWPNGVRAWKSVIGGFGDVLGYTEYQPAPGMEGYHTWALTSDGVLYKDGTNRIAFPPGVNKWIGVHGAGNALAVGDNGFIYLNGEQSPDLGLGGILWKDVSVGQNYMIRLSRDGEVYHSTRGFFGQTAHRKLPAPDGVKFTDMKSAESVVLLRGNDGKLYSTGTPNSPFEGPGGPIVPVPLPPGVTNFVSYAVGAFHAMVIGDDGELYTWGRNWEGQLGVGTQSGGSTNLQKVLKPTGVTAWTAAAGGWMHTMAIGNDCSLYVWGANDVYQLGLGPLPAQPSPQRVWTIDALCGIPVVYTNGETTRLEDGSFRIRFETTLNRPYLLQYSEDMTEWKTAYPTVIGTGAIVEWLDDGPPKTSVHPSQVEQRFYRIVFAP